MVILWMNAVSNVYGLKSVFALKGCCPLTHSVDLGAVPVLNLEKFEKLDSGKWVSTLLLPEGLNPDG